MDLVQKLLDTASYNRYINSLAKSSPPANSKTDFKRTASSLMC